MASVGMSPAEARTFAGMLHNRGVSVAVENSSRNSVIVGPAPALATAARLAATLGVSFTPLRATHAPHCALQGEAPALMRRQLEHVVQRRIHVPVFSPLRGRFYRDSDDLIGCLAEQLGAPIRFADAVARLLDEGITTVVECGPLRGLAATLDCHAVPDAELCRTLLAAPPPVMLRGVLCAGGRPEVA